MERPRRPTAEAHGYRDTVASILIIEDDQRIRQSLSNRLAERGHEVEAVGTAMSGVESAVSGRFDVVVLDLGLPDVDGAEALRMIRAITEVPVVVATARDDEAEIVRLLTQVPMTMWSSRIPLSIWKRDFAQCCVAPVQNPSSG